MLKLTFYLFLMLHTFACLWYAAITDSYDDINDSLGPDDQQWYAPYSWLNFPDQYFYTTDLSIAKKYEIMLYYAVMFLGANELGPVSKFEMIIGILILLACAFINAFVFGDMASLAE